MTIRDYKNSYSEKLKDPRWQKKRLQILERDKWACQMCFDTESTLHVHHRYYERSKDPWEYENHVLVTLCHLCHEQETISIKAASETLIQTLKKRFFASDILDLAIGFEFSEFLHTPEVISAAIQWHLEDAEAQKRMIDAYMDHLAKKMEKSKKQTNQ